VSSLYYYSCCCFVGHALWVGVEIHFCLSATLMAPRLDLFYVRAILDSVSRVNHRTVMIMLIPSCHASMTHPISKKPQFYIRVLFANFHNFCPLSFKLKYIIQYFNCMRAMLHQKCLKLRACKHTRERRRRKWEIMQCASIPHSTFHFQLLAIALLHLKYFYFFSHSAIRQVSEEKYWFRLFF
jgi:hypothetical protein